MEVEEALGNQIILGELHDNVNGVRPTLNEKALDDQVSIKCVSFPLPDASKMNSITISI